MLDLQYPIGKFSPPHEIDTPILQQWIGDIEKFPELVKQLTEDLHTDQLNWKYRPNGWKIKQLVHHCADSHMNSWIRFKWTLTEDLPTIKPYFEDRWAELPDSLEDNLEDSLALLTVLHKKWVFLLRTLTEQQLARRFIHPDTGKKITLAEAIGMYAWHCNHHVAHIKLALENKGEFSL